MRRLLAPAATALLVLGALAGCSSDGSVSVDNGKVKVDKNGNQITVKDGDKSVTVGGSTLPDNFPTDAVPLPKSASLKTVVSGSKSGDEYFSLTYTVNGDVKSAATSYKQALKADDYVIKASSSAGVSSAVFNAFTAVGSDWDVVVYSGGVNTDGTEATGALSLQVTRHNPSNG